MLWFTLLSEVHVPACTPIKYVFLPSIGLQGQQQQQQQQQQLNNKQTATFNQTPYEVVSGYTSIVSRVKKRNMTFHL